jgi:copper chaperone
MLVLRREKEFQVTTVVLTVPDISCDHCVRTVTETLTALDGVERVAADVATKQVEVEYDEANADVEQMQEALAEEEYPVAAVAR